MLNTPARRMAAASVLLLALALTACGGDDDDDAVAVDDTTATTASETTDTTMVDEPTTTPVADTAPCSATGSLTGAAEETFTDVPASRVLEGTAGTTQTSYSFTAGSVNISLFDGEPEGSVLATIDGTSFGGATDGIRADGSGADVDADLEAIGGGESANLTATVTCV